MSSPSQPFSKRRGYSSQPKEITIREEAPKNLRWFVRETAIRSGMESNEIDDHIVCDVLREAPDGEIKLYTCDWFYVYDVVERIFDSLKARDERLVRRGRSSDMASTFETSINEFFVEEGIGWQLVNGEIVTRGNEAFERTIEVAKQELSDRQTTRARIQEAINDLSRRPKPDLSGAVSHAFAAMECIIGDIKYTPEEIRQDTRHTFGSFLQRHPDLFPSEDFKDGFQNLWKYANNEGSRHGKEGMEPARDEAELIVSMAAALVTYLNRKHPR